MASGQFDSSVQRLSASESHRRLSNCIQHSVHLRIGLTGRCAPYRDPFPRIRRSSIWYSFIVCWILYCFSFLLNVSYQRGTLPPQGLCIVQAALLYSTIKMGGDSEGGTILTLLHIAPFTAYILVTVECLVFGFGHPDAVSRDLSGMYCNFTSGTGRTTVATLIIPCSICVLWLYVRIFTVLRKNANTVQRSLPSIEGVSWSVIVRVVSFCFLPMIGLVLGLFLSIKNHDWKVANSSQINLVSAIVPFICAVIFGSQKDILRVWTSRLHRSPAIAPCPICGPAGGHK
ncbi:hypothetical protein BDZ89DRAFT_1074677 [Hymenopellis radicata]|nr:hypothetical protein BDZ89DRAFT_1074677 [Hymenopellis radicata]